MCCNIVMCAVSFKMMHMVYAVMDIWYKFITYIHVQSCSTDTEHVL